MVDRSGFVNKLKFNTMENQYRVLILGVSFVVAFLLLGCEGRIYVNTSVIDKESKEPIVGAKVVCLNISRSSIPIYVDSIGEYSVLSDSLGGVNFVSGFFGRSFKLKVQASGYELKTVRRKNSKPIKLKRIKKN